MNWTNYFAVFAILSFTSALALVVAFIFADCKYSAKIFMYCFIGCLIASLIWCAVGLGARLVTLFGGM